MGVAMTGVVIPSFVVAPLLVMIFAITLHWLPAADGTAGAAIYDFAHGGSVPGLYRQYRAYYPRFDDRSAAL